MISLLFMVVHKLVNLCLRIRSGYHLSYRSACWSSERGQYKVINVKPEVLLVLGGNKHTRRVFLLEFQELYISVISHD